MEVPAENGNYIKVYTHLLPIFKESRLSRDSFMLHPSTLQLLRFHFSFFLLPVYLFALSQVPQIDTTHAILIFFILHVLVYPASNGYNSYMDRDETPIGGIQAPLPPTRQLFYCSVLMDVTAIVLSLFISYWFTICIVAYIAASRAYSYRGIRLKKYPVAGYLTVILFQGAVTYFMVYHGSSLYKTLTVPPTGMVAASLLIGGFYPLTQIYQHEADKKDGVVTISAMLGYKGTFIFTALIYSLAMGVLAWSFYGRGEQIKFLALATMMLPILVYFFSWAGLVWKDVRNANFSHTMRMNMLASICTNLAFLTLLIWRGFE
jgi:1,4-dihydroxy-2-naphthoate octaprenyltransferase